MKKIDISIVIPVFNASQNLKNLVDEIFSVLKDNFSTYELVLVNDKSTDNSWNIISDLCNEYEWIKGIELRKNIGQHNSILVGLKYAQGNRIITMDDDSQHSPKDIVALHSSLDEGHDVCYANYISKKHSFLRILGSKINNFVVTMLFGKPWDLNLTPFRCISYQVKDEMIKNKSPSVYLDGLILSITRNIEKIFVNHHDRKRGKSNYTFSKLVSLWMQMLTGFSVTPLRFASILGFLFSIAGFLIAIWLIFFKTITGDTPLGWTSLLVVILFLGGVQLIALGLIGEFLGRTYLAANNYPQFSVRKTLNINEE